MNFKILTLFPEMYPGPLQYSIIGRALKNKNFSLTTINIRDFSKKKSKSVDDKPFGGGAGMVIQPDILQDSLNFAKKSLSKRSKIIYLSPSGIPLKQKIVKKISSFEDVVLICGRYEGVDQRFIEHNDIEEISVGDYVLTGGEFASFILIDACVRLIPEVLGNNESLNSESFQNYLLEYPQYTKPLLWKKKRPPDVLLSGNHKNISDWRLKKSLEKTKKIRPDLYSKYKMRKKR
tara:strand:- start:256 stop:957 length:702 start_codon:yes stop_codon:yes gene_type:complete